MKLISFLLAAPVAVAYVIVLGVVLAVGITYSLCRDYIRHLLQRQLVQCSWCGCLYEKGVGRRLWSGFGVSTGSHGICDSCFHEEMRNLNQNHQQ